MKKLVDNHIVRFIKNVHVSVRLDNRIYKYIMDMEGLNFLDSLENLVIDHAKLTGRINDVIY